MNETDDLDKVLKVGVANYRRYLNERGEVSSQDEFNNYVLTAITSIMAILKEEVLDG